MDGFDHFDAEGFSWVTGHAVLLEGIFFLTLVLVPGVLIFCSPAGTLPGMMTRVYYKVVSANWESGHSIGKKRQKT
jgi:hypothetical protein